MSSRNTQDCEVCKYIRWYLMIGVPVIALMWTQPELSFLRGIDLTSMIGWFFSAALVVIIGWKYYDEFGRK